MAREDEQRLKDLLRNIETGDIPEDLPDPEEYDDMGGIKSLDRGAPSIKLASETGPEEFELELMSVIREFNDRMQNGELDPSTTIDEYINDYLSRKKMMMEDKNRQMAMYGGRMQYADGKKPDSMGNPAVVGPKMSGQEMREFMIMNPGIEDVADYKGYYEKKKKQEDEIKRMLDKAKKEKDKKAKGGIAGVL
jgi:hypothetical protein